MSAPPLKKEVRVCQKKHRHPDELTARAAAMDAIQRHGNTDKLFVYRCEHCKGWHLTRFPVGLHKMVTADNPVHDRRKAA
jgi:hypothetical protein